jgi:hypothetical protein
MYDRGNIHSLVYLTTGTYSPPKRVHHRLRYSFSSFYFQYPLDSLSHSVVAYVFFLVFLSLLPFSLFSSITCFRENTFLNCFQETTDILNISYRYICPRLYFRRAFYFRCITIYYCFYGACGFWKKFTIFPSGEGSIQFLRKKGYLITRSKHSGLRYVQYEAVLC